MIYKNTYFYNPNNQQLKMQEEGQHNNNIVPDLPPLDMIKCNQCQKNEPLPHLRRSIAHWVPTCLECNIPRPGRRIDLNQHQHQHHVEVEPYDDDPNQQRINENYRNYWYYEGDCLCIACTKRNHKCANCR